MAIPGYSVGVGDLNKLLLLFFPSEPPPKT